jgi:hypothetical protein
MGITMAITIWKTKANVYEKVNCPHCGEELIIYSTPFLRCSSCMVQIKQDLRDLTNIIADRCTFSNVKRMTH